MRTCKVNFIKKKVKCCRKLEIFVFNFWDQKLNFVFVVDLDFMSLHYNKLGENEQIITFLIIKIKKGYMWVNVGVIQ